MVSAIHKLYTYKSNFTPSKGFALSLTFTGMSTAGRVEVTSFFLTSSRGFGRSAKKTAVIKTEKVEEEENGRFKC